MEKNRLMWASRRGMLELDLMLQPFVEKHYDQLDQTDQQLFQENQFTGIRFTINRKPI